MKVEITNFGKYRVVRILEKFDIVVDYDEFKSLFRDFIKENRDELTACIKRVCPNIGSLNDNDRRQWIENDESLYNWARSEGVKI